MKTKKILALALAAVLLVAVGVGGTVAWLHASSNQVTNTFIPTTLDVTLDESENDYTMIPGVELPKDPKVDYSADVAAYVFVVVTENIGADITANGKTLTFDDFIDYSVVDGWLRLDGSTDRQEGVYYKLVAAGESVTDAVIIQDASDPKVQNQVTVKESVDKAMMDALKTAGRDAYPTLSFKAHICQMAPANDPATAWANYLNSGN